MVIIDREKGLVELKYLHSELRPHQVETLDQIKSSVSNLIVVEAPTGFGKSFLPAQLAHEEHRVMTLVKTKSLQGQYSGPPYFAKVVKGKNNYACNHNGLATSDLCKIYPKEDMIGCECAYDCMDFCIKSSLIKDKCKANCPYSIACGVMLDSKLASLNYAKYLAEIRPKGLVSKFNAQYLFLDECHDLSNLVIDYSGVTFQWLQYNKPAFILNYTQPPTLTPLNPLFPPEVQLEQKKIRIEEAIDWLIDLLAELDRQKPPKPTKRSSSDEIKYYKKWDSLYRKVGATIDMVDAGREHWYVQSNDEQFLLKPLTARYHFPQLFRAPKIVMMSATIGKVNPFMAELGIYENFESITVPNIWPPSSRPIYDLGGPRMSYKNTPQELQKHAQVIANALNNCNPEWTGIIHTNSKAKALALRNRLQREGVKRPLWVPPFDIGTEQALAEWLQFRQRNRGAIGLVYSFTEGVSLEDDKIVIMAWIPWPQMGDEYEKARFDFDVKAALGRVANNFTQGLGRTRRGREQDYLPGAQFVAVADSNYKRLLPFMNSSIAESIVKW